MTTSRRRRTISLEKMVAFMAEKGKILTEQEYLSLKNDVPLRWADIKHNFRTWRRMIGLIEQEFPLDYQALSSSNIESNSHTLIEEKLASAKSAATAEKAQEK